MIGVRIDIRLTGEAAMSEELKKEVRNYLRQLLKVAPPSNLRILDSHLNLFEKLEVERAG